MNTLKDIDKKIKELISQREELLGNPQGKYVVFDTEDGAIDQNTWVLSPKKKKDRQVMREYFESMPDKAKGSMYLDWLDEFESCACILGRVCPITESPVCCAECSNADLCEGRECKCYFVEIGEIMSVKDCSLEVVNG